MATRIPPPAEAPPREGVGPAVQEISYRAQQLVREEIELAKAEVAAKVSSLAKGIAVGVAGGIFGVVALLFFLHGLSWGFSDWFGGPAHQADRRRGSPLMAAQQRTPEQIRASIEVNRRELGLAIERLQVEVAELTNWRKKVAENQRQILIGAAVAGFLLGGGIAGVTGIFRRKR
jgi:hypothetical protein